MKPLYDSNGHTVKAVFLEKISNGAIAVHLRCCGDLGTDHVHTLYHVHQLKPEGVQADLEATAERVANQHASMLAVHDFISQNFLEEIEEPKPSIKLLPPPQPK